jgi:CheY-like chemotaxis protein
VDDSPEMRHVATRHLTSLGYRVLQADRGSAALEVLRSREVIDLLFTDIVMPDGLSGFQLAEAARRLRPGLRVLFTTGYAGGRRPEGEAAQLAERMIRKPYRRAELAEQVLAVMGEALLP